MQMNAYGGAQLKRFSPLVNFHFGSTDKICRVDFSFFWYLIPWGIKTKG